MAKLSNFISILFIVGICILGTMYLTTSLGSLDAGTNMTGSSYEDQYNSVTNISITTLSFTKLITPILAVIGMLILLGILYASAKTFK